MGDVSQWVTYKYHYQICSNMHAYPKHDADKNIGGESQYPSIAKPSCRKNLASSTHPYIHIGNPELIAHRDAAGPGKQMVKLIKY